MTDRESAEEIEAHATRWVVRTDKGDLDASEQAQLDAWLAGDSRRRGAFARAQAAWMMLDRAQALGSVDRFAFSNADPGMARKGETRRRAILGGVAVAAGFAAFTPLLITQGLRTRFDTALGEIRRVPLKDGSLAAINTQTQLAVDIQPTVRHVKLDRGEAWFEVAKDPKRPFLVASGPVRVRAVGTAFSVRKQEGGSEVLVTEGVVEVWSQNADKARTYLAAGQRAFVSDAAGAVAPKVAPLEIDRTLAWRDGQIILDGEPLVQAAAEFNRYNARKVVISDSDMGQQGLVGWFRVNDPEGFAQAAAATLGGQVLVRDNVILIARSNEKGVANSDGNPSALHP